MPTYRQVKLDIEAERVLAPTDWTMPAEEMCRIVHERTGYKEPTIRRALWAVMEWDLAHPGTDAVAKLRQHYNLQL